MSALTGKPAAIHRPRQIKVEAEIDPMGELTLELCNERHAYRLARHMKEMTGTYSAAVHLRDPDELAPYVSKRALRELKQTHWRIIQMDLDQYLAWLGWDSEHVELVD